jgi:hypothetical protein
MLVTGARLKSADASNLSKPVNVALRTRDKVAQTQVELLTWIKNLNPVQSTGRYWISKLNRKARGLSYT